MSTIQTTEHIQAVGKAHQGQVVCNKYKMRVEKWMLERMNLFDEDFEGCPAVFYLSSCE